MSGAVTASFAYDAWGRRTAGFGSQAGALGFAGQVTEPGLDLQYLRARYYDPKTAQFISRDPQEAKTRQPYLYAAGNPTMYTDPSGESIFGDAFGNLFGGLGRGPSWGAVKRGNPCSWWTFWGEQLGGLADPFRKIRALGTLISRTPLGSLLRRFRDEKDGFARVARVQGDPNAGGPHSVYKRGASGRVNGYTTYGDDGRPVKRFRGNPAVPTEEWNRRSSTNPDEGSLAVVLLSHGIRRAGKGREATQNES